MNRENTICAIATAPGHGAIAVIRLSGSQAIEITDKIFRSPSGKKLMDQKANTIHFGSIVDGNEVIDEVLVSIFKSPISYTGEDTIEISCHGSMYIQQQILQLLIKSGAEMAQPGEYTLRAFLNGKMDLSQAEAVADIIAGESKTSHDMAIHMIRGGFSKQINTLRTKLIDFCSLLELELDFSEEDVEFADRSQLKQNLKEISDYLGKLVNSFSLGNVLKNGVPVAIVGRPNVGKSTLLNTLLQEEKAIVSEIAGTTRDVIEDVINLDGVQFRFIDTAGIRKTTDTIESMGIERTFAKIEQARIILLMSEKNQALDDLKSQIDELKLTEDQYLILVINKIDQHKDQRWAELEAAVPHPIHYLSAKHYIRTHELTQLLLDTVKERKNVQSDVVISNARHYEALSNALEAAHRAADGLNSLLPSDLVAQDIREVLYYLSEITGEIVTDDILGNIFSKFCVGK
jgi:tRNA modification GTPase